MIYDQGSDTILDSFFVMNASIALDIGAYDANGLWVSTNTVTNVQCHIQPLRNQSDLQNLPDGILAQDCKKIFVNNSTLLSTVNQARPQITYSGRKYTLINIADYSEYGFISGILILNQH